MSNQLGNLYVVATPIGNLEDLTPRAQAVLTQAAFIAAEDTRHTGHLLQRFAIRTPLVALHEHNERHVAAGLVARIRGGESGALVSDAGTPLLSDPGYRLVQLAHEQGVRVIPVPGPCAAIAAVSVAGLPPDRIAFEGFPPEKTAARRRWFAALRDEPRTLVFYEAPHRVLECLQDLVEAFGAERPATLARELTKQFETVRRATLGELAAWVAADENQQRGEIVLVVQGAPPVVSEGLDGEAERVLQLLLTELSPSRAVALAEAITGAAHKLLYRRALELTRPG